ncbi:lytic transglycosylase domain-containing protein [Acidithiobacillus sp. CV18-2]|uniref:Lytic transglycosylase domain-containing protein n=1 Tax=Igneacidithiobacillus copahuensis TaxID=2724909 RepID=A0AAE2YQU3_9PROT|nr:lytic transglycosylase domain-containing protein [Igneacidithiobacillus copahuensis]MBU2754991.1 lytic transglycosylase domain-containing protein [Acidithiobacillus sp. CV18-3]MBU2755991.1 lytic transglycosylase domain-containing protein [Acidithiobacillus sp. BN09-2]MBU2777260.1 lytic transglycosylase domain-containing protein [Acidithiobacillus sp. CV18-2]MBU2797020.1 lytic transglycosylase domain-containing protein [Acidithiobacillus sp. VAN18-2]MBU2799890.1 lytic transglycosylase domain
MLLTTLAQQCAPQVAPSTLAAIVQMESGGNPWVLWDNTAHRGYHPQTRKGAERILRVLMAEGHQVDVGIAQVDTVNFAAYGLRPATAFDACTNLRVGAEILAADYRQATTTYGPGQTALYHAFEAYNSGRLHGDSGYANRILTAAGVPVRVSVAGALSWRHRSNAPMVFVETWGTTKPGSAPKAEKAAMVYALNW